MMALAESPYLLLLASGFFGGFGHCVGMCGPIVGAFSLSLKGKSPLWPQLLYNLGRISTYGMLGGVAGFTGSFVAPGDLAPLRRILLTATGVLVIVLAAGVGGWLPARFRLDGRGSVPGPFARFLALFTGGDGPGAFYPLGAILGFLPCGLVYGALLSAAGAGMEAGGHASGFFRGLAAMALFGAGTFPALLLLGTVVGLLGARLRARLHQVSAVLMILAGLSLAAKGLLR